MNKVVWVVVLVLVIGGIYWGMMKKGGESAYPTPVAQEEAKTEQQPVASAPEASVKVENTLTVGEQKVGKEVMVSGLTVNQGASIVVHKEEKGSAGTVIGTLTLKAGNYENQVVALSEALKAGQSVYVMLHPDNGDGKYTVSEEGTPLKNAQGEMLIVKVSAK